MVCSPPSRPLILDAFPPEKRGVAFGITGITMIVAPILGPTLGGFITDNYSWQWIFFMNVPIGLLAFWLVGRMVKDPEHAKAKGLISIDYIGLSLITLGLGALQIVLDKGQQEDWFDSNFIITYASIAFICLAVASAWLLSQKDAIVDLRLLALPSFGLSCLMMFFTGFCLYGGSTLIPILVQSPVRLRCHHSGPYPFARGPCRGVSHAAFGTACELHTCALPDCFRDGVMLRPACG